MMYVEGNHLDNQTDLLQHDQNDNGTSESARNDEENGAIVQRL